MTKTRVLRVDPARPDPRAIREAAEVLRAGRLVAFPTETVYGLGANALDAAAIDRIYQAKQRPASDPIIAHIYDPKQLDLLAVEIPPIARKLANVFWPGALTMVLRRAPAVPANIASGTQTVAVRMPSHPVSRALLIAANLPVAAPSANTFTRPSATTAAHVLEDLDGRIDLLLDGGETTIGLESTVIDLTGEKPVVLRPGGVLLEHLRAFVPEVTLAPRFVGGSGKTDTSEVPVASPGQMVKHYSPRAELMLFDGRDTASVIAHMQRTLQQLSKQGKRVGVLAPDEEHLYFAKDAEVKLLGSREDLQAISHSLFAAMRMLDGRSVDVILVRGFGQNGLGTALWDRLLRAAEGKVIHVD
ncbi:MAG: L-threonylcarbamoyladenylate synthase [bacterium]|nr:L-threonylcarbamoyladenylate synthase [bacterium]